MDQPEPSPFVLRWLPRLYHVLGKFPRALDVAMGQGRHTSVLAKVGFQTFGVDCDFLRVAQGKSTLRKGNLTAAVWVADLEQPTLNGACFDLILCTRYLQRTLLPTLVESVTPRGFIVYETFTTAQLKHNWGPRSREHLLQTGGELRNAFEGWEKWEYEEVFLPFGEARLVARKPGVYRSRDR